MRGNNDSLQITDNDGYGHQAVPVRLAGQEGETAKVRHQ